MISHNIVTIGKIHNNTTIIFYCNSLTVDFIESYNIISPDLMACKWCRVVRQGMSRDPRMRLYDIQVNGFSVACEIPISISLCI